jgi:nicotinate-nucleotide adenylyltransferase
LRVIAACGNGTAGAFAPEALKRMGLDRVWWLVSPGNPLKARGPAPLADRMARARAVMRDPRVVVSDLEARLGTRFTAETLERLAAIYPGVRFVWLMGADNLANFRNWRNWREVARAVPIAIVSRPGAGPRLRMAAPKGWSYLNARHNFHSATALRTAHRRPVAKPARK